MNLLRKTVAALVAALLFCTLIPAAFAAETVEEEKDYGVGFTEETEIIFAQATCNIRSGPGIQYPVIGYLQFGYSITRVARGDNGWSMVLLDDKIGYISSDLLTLERPKEYVTNLDDGELIHQIAIANGLNRANYTGDSWKALTNAMVAGNNALNGDSQRVVDTAVEKIRVAISSLVRMDYTALQDALTETEHFSVSGEMNELWFQLVTATIEGKSLLHSNDQSAVDAGAERINELLEQIQAALEAQGTPGFITQEVPVEVPPTDAYCNIPAHRLWMILFFASLVINVALVAVMVLYVRQKKKNREDTTPLVDYDIYDDFE